MDWHRRGWVGGASPGRKGSGRGFDHTSSLLPEQRWGSPPPQQMPSAHADTQVIKKMKPCCIPPPTTTTPFALTRPPAPTVLHSGFISSLWINRDTLSVQRGVVINVFSCDPRVKKTSTQHFFIIDVLFQRRLKHNFPIQLTLLF